MKLKDITTISSLDCRLKQYVIESIDEPDGPVNIYTAGATVHHCYSDDIEGITQITGNCVLLPTMGGVQREETIKYTEGRFIQTGNVILGLPYKIDIDSRWLWYRLCSNLKGLRKCYIGRHILNLDRTLLMKYEIGEVPAIDEQKRIAGILDKYLGIIEQLKDEQGLRKKQYEYYRDGLLNFPRRSRLDDLINEYCSEGVEYRRLGDIFVQFNGMGGVSNKWAESGNCLFIDYMNAYSNIKIDTTLLNYATVKNLNQNALKTGDILFTCSSETPNECAISSVIEDEIKENVFLDDHLFGIRIKDEYKDLFSIKYLKYYFRSSGFRTEINKVVRGVTRFHISKQDFMKLSIPIPPIEFQNKISKILDTFTELTEEIGNETELRIKQFNYYRKELMKQ